ncbi:MAG: thioredoxin family protein [Candidatus Dadabacteria bacterium]|nr:MAG: thioredoxin family protein [Candidatus Dadabacteria bacterium]
MVPLGTEMPSFTLPDAVSGNIRSSESIKGKKGTVVMFICNHCPYVKHIAYGLTEVANDYSSKGISFVAINSNDIESYPEDSPERMKEAAERYNYPFPYLFDETQEVAKAFQATCTPDIFVYDAAGKLFYRGQFDGARPGNGIPVTGESLRAALDALLEGKAPPEPQKPSLGCNIKWKR